MVEAQNEQKAGQGFVITFDTPIAEIGEKSSQALEYLMEYGLHCFHCPLSPYETIGIGAKIHGMTDNQVQDMIDDVNERLKNRVKG